MTMPSSLLSRPLAPRVPAIRARPASASRRAPIARSLASDLIAITPAVQSACRAFMFGAMIYYALNWNFYRRVHARTEEERARLDEEAATRMERLKRFEPRTDVRRPGSP